IVSTRSGQERFPARDVRDAATPVHRRKNRPGTVAPPPKDCATVPVVGHRPRRSATPPVTQSSVAEVLTQIDGGTQSVPEVVPAPPCSGLGAVDVITVAIAEDDYLVREGIE